MNNSKTAINKVSKATGSRGHRLNSIEAS